MKKPVSIIIALAVIALVIVITIQNSASVTVRLIGWKIESSLILVIFISFLAGALSTLLLMLPALLKKKKNKKEKTAQPQPEINKPKNEDL